MEGRADCLSSGKEGEFSRDEAGQQERMDTFREGDRSSAKVDCGCVLEILLSILSKQGRPKEMKRQILVNPLCV